MARLRWNGWTTFEIVVIVITIAITVEIWTVRPFKYLIIIYNYTQTDATREKKLKSIYFDDYIERFSSMFFRFSNWGRTTERLEIEKSKEITYYLPEI